MEQEEADLETVLSHLALAPDLSLTGGAGGRAPTPDWGVIPWPDVDLPDRVSFDYQPELASHPGPSPSIILQVNIPRPH